MGCYTLLVLNVIFLRFWLKRQNNKKDRAAAELAASGVVGVMDERLVHAFEDLTDRENPNFRYVY
jgi:hypothetical protein